MKIDNFVPRQYPAEIMHFVVKQLADQTSYSNNKFNVCFSPNYSYMRALINIFLVI